MCMHTCAFGQVLDRYIYIYIYIYTYHPDSSRAIYIYIMPSNIAIRARTMRVMKNRWLRARSDPGPFDKSKMDQGHSSNDINVSSHQPL